VAGAWARPGLGIEITGLVGIYSNPHHGIADSDLLAGELGFPLRERAVTVHHSGQRRHTVGR
jgi:hypothetical protein